MVGDLIGQAQHERLDNAFLRSENEKLKAENLALREAMANVLCSSCGGPATAAEVCFDEQQLRVENVKLQEEVGCCIWSCMVLGGGSSKGLNVSYLTHADRSCFDDHSKAGRTSDDHLPYSSQLHCQFFS